MLIPLDSPLVNLEHCPHRILSWLWEYHLLGNCTGGIEFLNYKNTHKAIPISIRHTSEGSKLGQSLEFPMGVMFVMLSTKKSLYRSQKAWVSVLAFSYVGEGKARFPSAFLTFSFVYGA